MPDSLVNEVEDRSIDGRKDGAIPSSVSIDKPLIRPARNGHLSRSGDVFWPRIGFQPRQGGLDGAECSDVVTKEQSRGGHERFIPARKAFRGSLSAPLLGRRRGRRSRSCRWRGSLFGSLGDREDLYLLIDRRRGTRRIEQLLLAEPDRLQPLGRNLE